jgi:hypothetical protein
VVGHRSARAPGRARRLYDRRMTVEEQFRDSKGCRFGVRREWTQFRTPAYLARFTLWVGVALMLWTVVGQAVATAAPKVCLPCRRKGPACLCCVSVSSL